MAWTDYSTTLPEAWSADIGAVGYSTGITYMPDLPPGLDFTNPSPSIGYTNKVSHSYNIPGFESSGYQPDGVNDPIEGDLGGGTGGGGSTRPSSGFLYPRGDC